MSGSSPLKVTVSAPHAEAVRAAGAAVDLGGNALDAALAAAATLTVVYPHQCSLGGDLIALVRRDGAAPTTTAVVSVGAAPAGIDVRGLTSEGLMPRQGPQTVTVPGVVEGWRVLADLGARRPLDEWLAWAGALASDGIAVSEGLARGLRERRATIMSDPGLRSVFASNGDVLEAGDTLVQPALAGTFDTLVGNPAAMYRGAIAERLVAGLRRLGGHHVGSDFESHRADVQPALVMDVESSRWYAAPPPSQGAVFLGLLPVALQREIGDGDLLTGCLDAMSVRDRVLGDPRGGAIDVNAMLRRELSPSFGSDHESSPASGDTVAVVATDTDGTTVSLIQSVYQLFGSGFLEPDTGIVLHNRGSAFSTESTSPARVGPGLRPPHTLCPVIAEAGGGVIGLGCQGGRAQPWILAQVARDLLDPAVDPAMTIARPRWVIGGRDLGHEATTLVVEPGLTGVVSSATALDIPVEHRPMGTEAAGHVQVVRNMRSGDGARILDGASDSRADGVTATFTRP